MRALFKKLIVALLTWEARMVLRIYKPKIVAVTGSVGKTSTKDAIYSVLAQHVFVRKSEKSFNSEVGIPLTIIGRPNAWNNPLRWIENLFDGLMLIVWRGKYPEWLVLEVGADRPGDISSVAKWLPASVVVMTRLPDVPVHVEFFDSPADVIREKASLLTALIPDGVFIANADDPQVMGLRDSAPGQSVTYGFSLGSDVMGSDIELLSESANSLPVGVQMKVSLEGSAENTTIRALGCLGTQALVPILAAVAVGKALGYPLSSMQEALAGHKPPPGRMRILPGLKETLIIDDTYNASPVATSAALDALSLLGSAKRRIAVLADMMELGRYSVAEHREVGKEAAEVADVLVTVGFRARDIAEGALNEGMPESTIFQFEDAAAAGKFLEERMEKGDAILIKGSQSMRMERAVEEVMAEPERASELLVRQDAEWRKR